MSASFFQIILLQMKFHCLFRLSKLGLVKNTGAKLDHRGVQTEEFVPESELPLA
jgi:hypothetical protein